MADSFSHIYGCCFFFMQKNNTAKTIEAQSPMAQALMKAQTTDKPKAKAESKKEEAPAAEETNIPAVERIKFNRDNAVVDNGNKPLMSARR